MADNLMVGSHKYSNDEYRKRYEETFKYGCEKCRELEEALSCVTAFTCLRCGKVVRVGAP